MIESWPAWSDPTVALMTEEVNAGTDRNALIYTLICLRMFGNYLIIEIFDRHNINLIKLL